MRVATSIGKPPMVNQTPFMIRSLGSIGRSLSDRPTDGKDYFRNEPVINDWIEVDGRSADQPFDGDAGAAAKRLILLDVRSDPL